MVASRGGTIAAAITCTVADAKALPFDDGSMDAVVSNFGIFLVPGRFAAWEEALRVLRGGGFIYASAFAPGRDVGSALSFHKTLLDTVTAVRAELAVEMGSAAAPVMVAAPAAAAPAAAVPAVVGASGAAPAPPAELNAMAATADQLAEELRSVRGVEGASVRVVDCRSTIVISCGAVADVTLDNPSLRAAIGLALIRSAADASADARVRSKMVTLLLAATAARNERAPVFFNAAANLVIARKLRPGA